MKNLKTLQGLLDERAEERAKEIVKRLCDSFHENNHVLNILDEYMATVKHKGDVVIETSLRALFWDESQTLTKRLVIDITQKLIPEVTKEFLDKVEELNDEYLNQ
jgi:hypothetical protein